MGPRTLIGHNEGRVAMLASLATDTPCPVRRELLRVGAEWSQFVGWMHRDIGDSDGARAWYDRALQSALRSGSADMVASALSPKSHLAWAASDAEQAVELAQASLDVAGAADGVRSLSAQQLARGHALAQERDQTERWLDEAERFTLVAVDNAGGQPPWIYFHGPDRLPLQRAIAYTELGDGVRAAQLLVSGLNRIDESSYRRDTGWHIARPSRALAVAGEVDESAERLVQAAGYICEDRFGADHRGHQAHPQNPSRSMAGPPSGVRPG